ncbi:MAG: hypothetical protein ACOYXT_13635 [Bacteroidota bacterium]
MIRSRLLLKSFAVFFLIEMFVNTVLPSVSFALTSGPTAPEATSFEPVDTTDMVNLISGDLTYNLPLLEVPGPSGGYPLSLSYHAGIMPNEEASWVGLGWTLNPGAINRSVNGYVDDMANALQTNRFVWEGGETHIASVGVGIAYEGIINVSAGLEFGHDTYQGFGGVGFNASFKAYGASFSGGFDPWDRDYASARVALVGAEVNGISAEVGISTNFEKTSSYWEASGNSMGVSIKASNRGSSAGFLGVSKTIDNGKTGKMSTDSWEVTVPIGYFYVGYKYNKYWIDETEKIYTHGVLKFPTSKPAQKWYDHNSYDVYSLGTDQSFIEALPAEQVSGGTFPSFDGYLVNAQGLSGSMRPFLYQKNLVTDNQIHYDEVEEKYKDDVIQYHLPYDNKPVDFRFINDFSNQYQYNEGSIATSNSNIEAALTYNFGQPTHGLNNNDGMGGDKLIGSRHIEYYLNSEIKSNAGPFAKFLESKASGFSRQSTPDEQIGAFTIINETGVRYHFSLPVYTDLEYQYSENINDLQGDTFNEVTKKGKYAYSWFLTAITGPDYIDRGQPGLDVEDWGHWVEFDYGKWTDNYGWRNPGQGMTKDIDFRFQNFSEGVKEIYYLDAVRTKSHTALFVKSIRHDAKGSIHADRDVLRLTDIYHTLLEEYVTIEDVTKTGGFAPKTISNTCREYYYDTQNSNQMVNYANGHIEYKARPTSSLKLDKICLIRNEDLATVALNKLNGSEYMQRFSYSWSDYTMGTEGGCDFADKILDHHLYQNVLDIYDYNRVAGSLLAKSVRVIDLETNYELEPETENSFDFAQVALDNPSADDNDYARLGKLTLKSLRFNGKQGISLTPPIRFNYELENPLEGFASVSKEQGSSENEFILTQTNSGLLPGNIIKIQSGTKTCYAVVKSNGPLHKVLILGKNMPDSGLDVYWIETQNPPYNDKLKDHWGMYKPDYQFYQNENVDRIPSKISAANVDVWSLRKITTSMGATISIDYGSDAYSKAVLYRNGSFMVDFLEQPNKQAGTVEINLLGGEVSDILNSNDYVEIALKYVQSENGVLTSDIYFTNATKIVSVSQHKITIQDPNLVNFFFYYKPTPESTINRQLKGGNIFLRNEANIFGGGLRVNSISSYDPITDTERKMVYDYQRPDKPELISGVISYEPVGMNRFVDDGSTSDLMKNYRNFMLGKLNSLLTNVREAPAPGVMYEYVTVKEFIRRGNETVEVPFYTTYQFEVFNKDMIKYEYSSSPGATGFGNISYDEKGIHHLNTHSNATKIKNFTSLIGSMKKTTLFDKATGKKVTETFNHYLQDKLDLASTTLAADYPGLVNSLFKGQGIIHETYATGRFAKDPRDMFSGSHNLLGVLSKVERYPAIQTGTSTINYKTGIKTESENFAFDFYSGKSTKVYSTDGYGNRM